MSRLQVTDIHDPDGDVVRRNLEVLSGLRDEARAFRHDQR